MRKCANAQMHASKLVGALSRRRPGFTWIVWHAVSFIIMSAASESDDSSDSSSVGRVEANGVGGKNKIDTQITSFFQKKLPPENPRKQPINDNASSTDEDSDYKEGNSKKGEDFIDAESEDGVNGSDDKDECDDHTKSSFGDPAFEEVTPQNRSQILSRGRLQISNIKTTFPKTSYKSGGG